jgi:hypothetical protein
MESIGDNLEHRLELRILSSGGRQWYDADGSMLIDDEPLVEELRLWLPESVMSELSLLSGLTGRTLPAIVRNLILDYLRPGSVVPMERIDLDELLQRRAQSLIESKKKPRPPRKIPDYLMKDLYTPEDKV